MMKKVFIYSFGCKVNRYETQLIIEKLTADGFEIVKEIDEADLIIFNSCSVTEKADAECLYFIRKSLKLKQNPQIIITGCMAINKYENLKEKFPTVEIIKDKKSLYSNLSQTVNSFNFSRAFIKIQDGCDAFCSYCIIPFIRNSFWSKPEKIVLSEIETLVKNGYSEIVLSGIHIGKYDGGLSDLIEKILNIPLDFRIRISSIEINEIDKKLLSLMKESANKICAHLHIPLQSASDKVLKLMNRKYTSADFERKVNKIAENISDIAITSDIITGFPQEIRQDHKTTCEFLMKNPFSRLHIFKYSDREKTKAFSFEGKVDKDEIKARSKELLEIDAKKREIFLKQNKGKTRKAVSIGKNKVLTDNYIETVSERKIDGIFDVKI